MNATKRAEAIAKSKGAVDELISAVMSDGGRWRFKNREGRTGAKLTKDHLESVFIVAGNKVPTTRIDDLLLLVDELFTHHEDIRRAEAGRFDHVLGHYSRASVPKYKKLASIGQTAIRRRRRIPLLARPAAQAAEQVVAAAAAATANVTAAIGPRDVR